MNYGYIRVSTDSQNTDRQIEQLKHCDRLFTDKLSGKNSNRPQLQLLLGTIMTDDIITVCSIDRLARNTIDLLALVKQITDKRVTIKFIKENLSFSGERNAINDLMLTMLGAIASFERDMINSRVREGIAVRRDKGKYKLTTEENNQVKQMLRDNISKTKIAKQFNISRQYLYKIGV